MAAGSGAGERAGGGDGGAVAEPPSVDQVLREHGCLRSHRQQLLGYRDRLAKTQGQLAETNKQLSQTSREVVDTKKRINELVKVVTVPFDLNSGAGRQELPGGSQGLRRPHRRVKLSQNRSEAVVQYLTVKHQIPLMRIMVPMGYARRSFWDLSDSNRSCEEPPRGSPDHGEEGLSQQ